MYPKKCKFNLSHFILKPNDSPKVDLVHTMKVNGFWCRRRRM